MNIYNFLKYDIFSYLIAALKGVFAPPEILL